MNLSSLFASFAVGLIATGQAHAGDNLVSGDIRARATSTIPVEDDRIAALWVLDSSDGDAVRAKRECTAGNLGGQWWVTAHHCVAHVLSMHGYLAQSDGEVAGIANIYVMSDRDDVALIKVSGGINAPPFRLPTQPLTVGDQASMIGFGATNDFASIANTTITGVIDILDFGAARYTQLFEARSITSSRSCSGDSGGPVFSGDTIYALHTAGGHNPVCIDGKDKAMWHTDLAPRTKWIATTMSENHGLTAEEEVRAHAGLRGFPAGDDVEFVNYFGSALSSSN